MDLFENEYQDRIYVMERIKEKACLDEQAHREAAKKHSKSNKDLFKQISTSIITLIAMYLFERMLSKFIL